MYYTEEFINHVKEVIESQSIPPSYNPEEWEGKSYNCYAYALRICMDIELEFRPGFTTGVLMTRKDYTQEKIIELFFTDCRNLNLNVSETTVEEKIGPNEYKIAIYVIDKYGFHFSRQDSNGGWSQKNGWTKPISIVNEEDISKDDILWKFVGVFRISKKEG